MDPTTLYYALSTIAQCAAALAALIGFLGLWRLDRLRQERDQHERDLRGLLAGVRFGTLDAPVLDLDRIIEEVRKLVAVPAEAVQTNDEKRVQPKLTTVLGRWDALPGEQQRLMGVVQRFLRRTLVILALAIVGLAFTDAPSAWIVTAVIARLLVLLAGYRLGRDTYAVVREAARSTRTT